MIKNPVLIVGAGPTGLVLALWLARLGVPVRLVDKASGPGLTSRAVGVQARTLELYRQLGFADEIVADGLPFAAANFWAHGEHRGRAAFGDIGEGLSPYPFMLMYPQDRHEVRLIEKLAALGVQVERNVELIAFDDGADHVTATLRTAGGTDTVEAAWLAGCDGAHSAVRRALGVGFGGGTYAHLFYVADVQASGPSMNREGHVLLDEHDVLACFPLREPGRARLVGTVRPEAEAHGGDLDFHVAVDHRVLSAMRLDVQQVHWFSTYRVHHRVATTYRAGRAFLLGDAAHLHSPIGGQGMNTGIGDAVNLAWKIAAVYAGSPDTLLDTYESERQPFAETLVHTTDRLFELVSNEQPLVSQLRARLAPSFLSGLTRFRAMRRLMFDTISQTKISYRHAPLGEGQAGSVHGGDRLPWTRDNFDALSSLAFQVHVYGAASPEIEQTCAARGLPLHVFPFGSAAAGVGLQDGAAYLVRPDSYVALATTDAAAIPAYLDRHGL